MAKEERQKLELLLGPNQILIALILKGRANKGVIRRRVKEDLLDIPG